MADIAHTPGMPATTDAFIDTTSESMAARLLRALAELALVALMVVFVRGTAPLSIRYRAVLAIFVITLPAAGWMVYRLRTAGMGARLWLIASVVVTLSLCVPKQNLQRPPSMQAAECVFAMGCLGILSAIALGRRFPRTGFEPSLVVSVAGAALIMGLLFPSVAAQNGLDPEVIHNAYGSLLDYFLALCGAAAISGSRASYVRSAVIIALACLIRLLLHHAAPTS